MSVVPNQSFLAKQMQNRLAAAIGSILFDLGVQARPRDRSWLPGGTPNDVTWYPTTWRIGKQVFYYRPNWGGGGGNANVEFSNARFDPRLGNIWRGPKKVAQNVKVNDDAKTKIIKNDTGGAVHVAYEESEDVTRAFSSSVSKGVALDMTSEHGGTISSETTAEVKVSGEYMGVTAEAGLSETFGVSKSSSSSKTESESKEEGKEKSEEGTKSEKLAIEFDAVHGAHYLLTISKEHETSYQPFKINGVMDFDIHLHMPRHTSDSQQHSSHHPGTDVRVIGMDGFFQFVEGYDTNYPKMEGFIHEAYSTTRKAYDWLQDPANRYIEIEGSAEASLESNADYHLELLGSSVPDALAHLPVVNAEDLAA